MLPETLKNSFRASLFSGSYNLLFGSGISLDSTNNRNETLRSSEQLRCDLCRITKAPESTFLSRAYSLLTQQQIEEELITRFSVDMPGPTVTHLPTYLWRRLFTFNIDDVLEKHYASCRTKKQKLSPLNFDSPFEPTPDKQHLQAIHLHGWVQKPKSNFVFSASEYVRIMRNLNPWMHLLSEILATEPFIIAGTSMNEIDLEYYLNYRTAHTPRRDRGPSLLIEPYPNVVTESDCTRYGLHLVRASFKDFMEWLRKEFPTPPAAFDLMVPDTRTLFIDEPQPRQLLRFFSDFELVHSTDRPLPTTPSSFLYGREPQWDEIQQHIDIERHDNFKISEVVENGFMSHEESDERIIVVLDEAGTGKTTTIKRVAHDLARGGRPVLSVRTLSRIDTGAAIACLSMLSPQVLLLVDGFADHAEQIAEIVRHASVASRVVTLAAERSYRQQYIEAILGSASKHDAGLSPFTQDEALQLIERYRRYGLIGTSAALKAPQEFAARIMGEPVAVAICRVLNDFKPLEKIVESLLRATRSADRLPYLCVALAQHCYWGGIRYSLVQSVAGPGHPINELFENTAPLRLAFHPAEDDFVVCLNSIIGEQLLWKTAREAPEALYSSFVAIAKSLAPHVNRKAIMRRSPDARLAGRLFDADKIVKPLLGDKAKNFYIEIQGQWEWNSRYWEQRALLAADSDLETAIRYARHAITLELHPFSLTTLSKILLMVMDTVPSEREIAFIEAFDLLNSAIDAEKANSRITVHPYSSLFSGTARYLELEGILTSSQNKVLLKRMSYARERFAREPLIETSLQRLESAMH